MSHRGQNQTADTVQVWDGTRWVAYNSVQLKAALSAVPNALWHEPGNSVLGYTTAVGMRNALGPEYNGGPANPAMLEKVIYAQRLGAANVAQNIDLPTAVLGISAANLLGGNDGAAVMVAEVVIAVTQANASGVISVSKYLLAWNNIINQAAWDEDTTVPQPLNNTVDANLIFSYTSIAGVPRLTVNYTTADSGSVRYMLEIRLKVMGALV